MKLFYIFILSLFIFLLAYCQKCSREYFTTKTKNIILLGDSILHNNIYTSTGKGVCDIVKERNPNTICYATDNSKIIDVYRQLDNIPLLFNNSNTFLFLSVGANDLLFNYEEQQENLTDMTILTSIFSAYKNLIKSIQTKLPNINIILLDIYYPTNLQYKPFYQIIKEWNTMLYTFTSQSFNKFYLLKISTILTDKTDFSFNIEPSDTGSIKIANSILSFSYW